MTALHGAFLPECLQPLPATKGPLSKITYRIFRTFGIGGFF
jgi:hypothetical protein